MRASPKLPPDSEKSFQGKIRALARLYHWKVYHTYLSIRSDFGFPDLVLLRPPRLIFAELKQDGKRPTADQEGWLQALGSVPGVEVYVWRPGDWKRIVATLEA